MYCLFANFHTPGDPFQILPLQERNSQECCGWLWGICLYLFVYLFVEIEVQIELVVIK